MRAVYLLLLALLLVQATAAQTKKGKLFIIGGGEINDALRKEILTVGNWKKGDKIVAVTLASGYGDSAYIWINEDFRKVTGEDCIKFDSASVHDPVQVAALAQAKIIYLGGGDQERFMRLIQGTAVKKAIQSARNHGSLIAGTSAGASVMSERMITGNALLDSAQASTFRSLRKGNLELKEGLGLLDSVIIDQHFLVRSRYTRMLSAIMEHPNYQCLGINESTAIIVEGNTATVTGESQVVVFAKPKRVHSTSQKFLAGAVELQIYVSSEKFAIKK